MSKLFDRQQDALPAAYVGTFRLQDIRRAEYERNASSNWSLLAAVDEYVWARSARSAAFHRGMPRLGAEETGVSEVPSDERPLFSRAVRKAGVRR